MKAVIDKMRADFVIVAAARCEAGLWTGNDERLAGGAIKAAIDKNDTDMILCWSRWLAVLSARDLMESNGSEPSPTVTHACSECEFIARPGRSAGYCSGREDLAKAYGESHPLRVLPNDGGASCMRFRVKR